MNQFIHYQVSYLEKDILDTKIMKIYGNTYVAGMNDHTFN